MKHAVLRERNPPPCRDGCAPDSLAFSAQHIFVATTMNAAICRYLRQSLVYDCQRHSS